MHQMYVKPGISFALFFFATNSQCTFPLHTFLTDACGGSTRLIKLSIRFGICSSADTHARYVQYRLQKIVDHGVMTEYPNSSFTLASVDNIRQLRLHTQLCKSVLWETTVKLAWYNCTAITFNLCGRLPHV